MRALSWKMPYGLLMLPPYNKIETRTWSTTYRGQVLICASKAMYSFRQLLSTAGCQFDRIQYVLDQPQLRDEGTFTMRELSYHLRGHAFAVADLVDCRQMQPEDEKATFVMYKPGLYCHIYENVKPLKNPIPWQGRRGWSMVPEQIIDRIEFK